MRINLRVPYSDKDMARKRGARWDAARRVWYVENLEDIGKFLCWMPDHLRQPPRKAKA